MTAVGSLSLDLTVEDERWTGSIPNIEPVTQKTLQTTLDVLRRHDPWPMRLSVAVTLTTDAEIRPLNLEFRDQDKATNVLSFPAWDGDDLADLAAGNPLPGHPEELPVPMGDIVVAWETVEREALSQHKTVQDHVQHLLTHGFLHLFGYDHGGDEEAADMEALEIDILQALGIPNPYILTS